MITNKMAFLIFIFHHQTVMTSTLPHDFDRSFVADNESVEKVSF